PRTHTYWRNCSVVIDQLTKRTTPSSCECRRKGAGRTLNHREPITECHRPRDLRARPGRSFSVASSKVIRPSIATLAGDTGGRIGSGGLPNATTRAETGL